MARIRRDFGVGDLAAAAGAAGITRTILVQVLPDAQETAEFLALAAGSTLIGGVVGWVDLTRPDVADVLAALAQGPGGDRLVGVRHLVQSEPDPGWLLRPDVGAGLRAVGAAGLSYDLLTRVGQLPAAIQAVRGAPETGFVLDHLSKPAIASGELEPWASRIRELAAEPNVYAKLSGLVTEADWGSWTVAGLRPYAETALEAFGPARVMFGSDWPVCLLAASYEQVAGAARELLTGLSAAERDQVLGGTAAGAYRLAGPGRS
jgi:L-fuconolactonase